MKEQIEVLYQDNHLFAARKPAGIPTQSEDGTAFEALCRLYLKEKLGRPGNVFLHAVHRIDTPVSGIVLFARTGKALSRLQESMRGQKIERYYLAVVEGKIGSSEGSLRHKLLHDERAKKAVVSTSSSAKDAELDYKVIKEGIGRSLVEVRLKTGRYHQIRAQFTAISHPVIGDLKYGSKTPFEPGAIALHHHRLIVPHPTKECAVEIVSEWEIIPRLGL